MPKLLRSNFKGGEWSPLLEGRSDLEGYYNASRRLENVVPLAQGGITRRPGFRYIEDSKGASSGGSLYDVRLVPFEFSTEQTYILEFGHQYIRVYMDQGQVLDGGSPYEIVSPYSGDEVFDLRFTQSADVLFIFHPDYQIRKLSRTGHTSWALNTMTFTVPPTAEQPYYPNATLTLAAVTGTNITFTAGSGIFLDGDIGKTIISGTGRATIISYISATQVKCDIRDDFASVGPIASGSWHLLYSSTSQITVNNKEPVGATVSLISAGQITNKIDLVDGGFACAANYWTLSGSGTNEYYLNATHPDLPGSKPDAVYEQGVSLVEGSVGSLGIKQWDWADNDALGYSTIYIRLSDGTDPDSKCDDSDYVQFGTGSSGSNVFRSDDIGKYVRLLGGMVKITAFVSALQVTAEIVKILDDVNMADATTKVTANWTLESEMWNATNGYPSTGCFYENRLAASASAAYPLTVWASSTGDYEDFYAGTLDADSVQFTMLSRLINKIRWLAPMRALVAGTTGSEYRITSGGDNAPITPTSIDTRIQTMYGSADIDPVLAANSCLFLQRGKRKIREFTYQWESDGYVAPDLTILAEHITESGIVDMAYQQEPFSILWCVRADGKLAALTYNRSEETVAWSIHDTDGLFKSVAVIENDTDGYSELWAVVERTINGSTVRYVEMLEAFYRDDSDTYDTNKGLNAFFVDCGYTYNGASTTTITGLSYLEGKTVSVLADGAAQADKTVSGGQITLDPAASVVHVGLLKNPLTQPMRIGGEIPRGTIFAESKKVNGLALVFDRTMTAQIGVDEDNLEYVPCRDTWMAMDNAPSLYTGIRKQPCPGGFNDHGRVIITTDKPTPFTLLGIVYDVAI